MAQASGPAQTHKVETGVVYTMTNASDGNAVMAYLRAPNGTLTPAGTYPTDGFGLGAGLGNQGGVVLSDDNRWLFVVNAGSNELTVFAVTKQGLKRVQTVYSEGTRPVSVTSNDDLVYVLNAGSDSIAGFRMAHKGKLEPILHSYRPLSGGGTAPAQIQFSPGGRDLVITEKATNKLVVYEMDRDGVPEDTPEIIASAGQTPFGFSFGKHRNLFVSEAAGGAPNASSVSSYHLTRDGGLNIIDAKVPTGLTAACWIVVTPDGRYLYATDAGSGAISGYRIDPAGNLSLLNADGITASTGTGSAPIDMAVSGNGRFLYALSTRDHSVSEFRIQADGSLTPIGTLHDLPEAANGLAAF
jgi:6-phosphogluconolactonase (cycloisomerase 2 family)